MANVLNPWTLRLASGLAAALLLLAPAVRAQDEQIYTWTDSQGEVHYTNDRATVPEGAQVRKFSGEDGPVLSFTPADSGQAGSSASKQESEQATEADKKGEPFRAKP